MPPPKAPNPYPWFPSRHLESEDGRAEYAIACSSVQRLAQGTADEHAQKQALDYIINTLCNTYDLSFRPDEQGGRRATDFAEGKRFVGLQLIAMLKTSVTSLTTKGRSEQG